MIIQGSVEINIIYHITIERKRNNVYVHSDLYKAYTSELDSHLVPINDRIIETLKTNMNMIASMEVASIVKALDRIDTNNVIVFNYMPIPIEFEDIPDKRKYISRDNDFLINTRNLCIILHFDINSYSTRVITNASIIIKKRRRIIAQLDTQQMRILLMSQSIAEMSLTRNNVQSIIQKAWIKAYNIISTWIKNIDVPIRREIARKIQNVSTYQYEETEDLSAETISQLKIEKIHKLANYQVINFT
jgi:hypothetical protein